MDEEKKLDPVIASLLQDVEMLLTEVVDWIRGRETSADIEEHLRLFRQRRIAVTPDS